MTGDTNLLQKFGLPTPTVQVAAQSSKGQATSKPDTPEPDEEIADLCFGCLRGIRDRALNLEFRRIKEGDSVAFPYSWLGPTRFDPSIGVLMLFVGAETYGVRIRGRNLNSLLAGGLCLYDRGILRHRVTFVREMSKEECRNVAENECVIERIEVVTLPAEEEVSAFLGLSAKN